MLYNELTNTKKAYIDNTNVIGIEYDKDDNIIDASCSDYIINVVKDKQFNKAKILVKYIESYFEDNGGKC